jgi:hypothetical protein
VKWTDPDFPPEADTIANEDDESEAREKAKKFTW